MDEKIKYLNFIKRERKGSSQNKPTIGWKSKGFKCPNFIGWIDLVTGNKLYMLKLAKTESEAKNGGGCNGKSGC